MSATQQQVKYFWGKVAPGEEKDCWPWHGWKTPEGYGQMPLLPGKRLTGAHRFSYELLVGPIPAGLVIDHLCRNRLCVNPAHMEPVTNRENILRGTAPPAMWAARTHCLKGHKFPEPPKLQASGRIIRRCQPCQNGYNQRRRARLRASEALSPATPTNIGEADPALVSDEGRR